MLIEKYYNYTDEDEISSLDIVWKNLNYIIKKMYNDISGMKKLKQPINNLHMLLLAFFVLSSY